MYSVLLHNMEGRLLKRNVQYVVVVVVVGLDDGGAKPQQDQDENQVRTVRYDVEDAIVDTWMRVVVVQWPHRSRWVRIEKHPPGDRMDAAYGSLIVDGVDVLVHRVLHRSRWQSFSSWKMYQ